LENIDEQDKKGRVAQATSESQEGQAKAASGSEVRRCCNGYAALKAKKIASL